MINVEFIIEPGSDIEAQLREWSRIMPWVKYLVDNHTRYEYEINHNANTYQDILRLRFDLPPQKETFFNIKFR
jgi:hypothetical protein